MDGTHKHLFVHLLLGSGFKFAEISVLSTNRTSQRGSICRNNDNIEPVHFINLTFRF